MDLHIHSTCSDGSFTPREIVELARAKGLKAIAIADHDTVEGVAEAVAAGAERSIEVVPAVELSIKNEPEKDFVELHLLATSLTIRMRNSMISSTGSCRRVLSRRSGR